VILEFLLFLISLKLEVFSYILILKCNFRMQNFVLFCHGIRNDELCNSDSRGLDMMKTIFPNILHALGTPPPTKMKDFRISSIPSHQKSSVLRTHEGVSGPSIMTKPRHKRQICRRRKGISMSSKRRCPRQ
jgi:hypothetical protein